MKEAGWRDTVLYGRFHREVAEDRVESVGGVKERSKEENRDSKAIR